MKRIFCQVLLLIGCIAAVYALTFGAVVTTVSLAGGSLDDVQCPSKDDSIAYHIAWYAVQPSAALQVSYYSAFRKCGFDDTPTAQILYINIGMVMYGLILYLAIHTVRMLVRKWKGRHPTTVPPYEPQAARR